MRRSSLSQAPFPRTAQVDESHPGEVAFAVGEHHGVRDPLQKHHEQQEGQAALAQVPGNHQHPWHFSLLLGNNRGDVDGEVGKGDSAGDRAAAF
eukprot:4775697-Prorocentrum_lima.AAC.1